MDGAMPCVTTTPLTSVAWNVVLSILAVHLLPQFHCKMLDMLPLVSQPLMIGAIHCVVPIHRIKIVKRVVLQSQPNQFRLPFQ